MKFNIKLTIEIDEEERILPIVADMHEEAVTELFQEKAESLGLKQ